MFDSIAQERIGYYVYALFDPRTPNLPFYIGKGRGNRVFCHANGDTLYDDTESEPLSPKMEKINEILKNNKKVIHKIIRFDLAEEEAFSIEASLIDIINHIEPETLQNQVSGHGTAEGIIDANELSLALSAEPLKTEEPILIIKIERLWGELLIQHKTPSQVPRSAIFDAVKGNWKVSKKRANSASYVLAVSRGIVRAVFKKPLWTESEEEGRKCFTCDDNSILTNDYVGKSVTSLFKRGGQNPVRYQNC